MTMLHGLPTDVYRMDTASCQVSVRTSAALRDTSSVATRDFLEQATEIGAALLYLRHWTRASQRLLYIQSIQASIEKHLSQLYLQVNHLETSYLTPSSVTIVSVADLRHCVETISRPFVELSHIVKSSTQLHHN